MTYCRSLFYISYLLNRIYFYLAEGRDAPEPVKSSGRNLEISEFRPEPSSGASPIYYSCRVSNVRTNYDFNFKTFRNVIFFKKLRSAILLVQPRSSSFPTAIVFSTKIIDEVGTFIGISLSSRNPYSFKRDDSFMNTL